jgi:hypothetical protein
MIVKYSLVQLITIWMLCNFRFADSFVVKSLGRRFVQLNRRCAMNLEKAIPSPPSRLLGKQVIVLAGATSVGKSAVAAELCKIIDAEIVLADCVQVRSLPTTLLSDYSGERKLKVRWNDQHTIRNLSGTSSSYLVASQSGVDIVNAAVSDIGHPEFLTSNVIIL